MRYVNKITANYYFSHIVLRDLFLGNEIYDVVNKMEDSEVAFNQFLKARLYESILESKTPIYNTEDFKDFNFNMKIIEFSNCSILFVNMPDPQVKGDTYCVAVLKTKKAFTYFILELAVYNGEFEYVISFEDQYDYTVLKKLDTPSEDEFVEYMHQMVTNGIIK
ncbi:MAG: hypothetical protein E7184_00580 [Erysipelotrichaceae bacterium]|nr:hypothetical protein [Erysipelotrichaceae bacterium]